MTVRPIDANMAMKKIRDYMEDFPNAGTRLATCRVILSMLGDENQIPTLTQPNEPLTLKQLREMDGQPVWVTEVQHWALVDVDVAGKYAEMPFANWNERGCSYCWDIKGRDLHCYRRPPEGEEKI